jgi:hypothetical protein
VGAGGAVAIALRFRRRPLRQERLEIQTVIERVRAVGKLVGLEVCAKEIATATSGWAWLPPIVLSQARLAMIFNFEKQYSVDLSSIGPKHIREAGADSSPSRSRRSVARCGSSMSRRTTSRARKSWGCWTWSP